MSQHILIYTDEPGVGGIAQYNHTIAMALAQRGDRVTVVQSARENPLLTAQQQVGIYHHWLPFDTMADFQRTFEDTTLAREVLEAQRPDLILFSDGCPLSNFAAKQVAIALKIPFLMVIGFVAPSLSHHFSAEVDPTPVLQQIRTTFEQARAVVAVSQNNLDLLRTLFQLPPERGQVIYCGRPAQYFEPQRAAVRDRLRHELQLPEEAILGFTAARLEPIKGYQYQLEAMLQLRQSPEFARLHLAWAGAGQLQSWLAQNVQAHELGDRIHFLGMRWDIAEWLDAIDLFVLPSEAEGLPFAIMEAMAKGVPVIASAVSGIPEALGETGYLIPDPTVDPQTTVQALVKAWQALIGNAPLRSNMGLAERQRAMQLFQETRMVAETLNVIERSLLPAGDYVSPGLAIVRPDAAFPHKVVADPATSTWTYLRREIPHNWYVDQRQPIIGFLSRDEAHILYNLALPLAGQPALEIGCWVGWSACHLALAGVNLDVVDPLLARPEILATVESSLTAAGVRDRVNLVPGSSPDAVHQLAQQAQRQWSLIFIDGDHEAGGPLADAIACAQYAAPDALIVFHDLASPDVSAGLDYFRQQGWQTLVYQTMQIMGIAWRGQVQPIEHHPDPGVNWTLPDHLQGYTVSGQPPATAPIHLEPLEQWLQILSTLTLPPLPAIAPALAARQQLPDTLQQAQTAYVKGDWETAKRQFQKVLTVNPASAIAHAHLSTLWRSQDLAQSIRHHALAQSAHTLTVPAQDAEFLALWEIVQPFTLLSQARLFSLYSLTKQICLDDIPGDVVECGSYRGGAAAVMATVIQRYSLRPRQVCACDTFAGMPDPTPVDRHDGILANETGYGAGTLVAPIADYLEQICQILGVSDIVVPMPGLFAATLPSLRSEVAAIALLHADGDWYESTLDIFTHLYDRVVADGFIQIDDYGHWQGCRQAVHEFERQVNAVFPLRWLDYTGVWCRKTDPADANGNYGRSLWLLAQTASLQPSPNAKRLWQVLLNLLPGLVAAETALIELGTDPAVYDRTMTDASAALDPQLPNLDPDSLHWVVFPDWHQPEAMLLADLVTLLRFVITHPDRDRLSLLLVSDVDSDELELALAAASLHLFETETFDFDDYEPAIAFTPALTTSQWQTLAPLLIGHLRLAHEDQAAVAPFASAIAQLNPADPDLQVVHLRH